MAAAFKLKLTDEGIRRLKDEDGTGTASLKITNLAITQTSFVPTSTLIDIPDRLKDIPLNGIIPAIDHIVVSALDSSTDTYTLRGFGLYFEDGVLFGSFSDPDFKVTKESFTPMVLQSDFVFKDGQFTSENVVFGSVQFTNPTATELVAGKVKLITDKEQMWDLTDSKFADATVSARLVKELILVNNIPIGTVFYRSLKESEAGSILANGSELSIEDFPKLFDHIGYTYGRGTSKDSQDRDFFLIPDLRGVFIRGMDEGSGIDPGRILGELQQDAIKLHNHKTSVSSEGAHLHDATALNYEGHVHTGTSNTTGGHTHTGHTTASGTHVHWYTRTDSTVATAGGPLWLHYVSDRPPITTEPGGNHSHDLNTSTAGNHAHTITIAKGGAHTHSVSVSSGGNHIHTVSVLDQEDGEHETRPVNQAQYAFIRIFHPYLEK